MGKSHEHSTRKKGYLYIAVRLISVATSTAASQSTLGITDEGKRASVAFKPAQGKYGMTTLSDPPLSPEVDAGTNSITCAAE